MSLVVKETGGLFTPCPAGLHQAVCVDVVDLGEIEVTYNGKTVKKLMMYIVWQIDEEVPDKPGEFFTARRRYNQSLHEKAALRKDLETWRGKPFTPEQLRGFDVDALLGANCQISVAHEARDGKTYANVTAVVPLGKGMVKMEPKNYTRMKDRPKDGESAAAPNPHGVEIGDDDVPF